ELYVDMVKAAEYSGTLDRVLIQVAGYLQRQDTAMKKLRSAMIYPGIILVLAIAVCTTLIVFVLPNFVQMFKEFKTDLPLPTKVLLWVGTFAQEWRTQIVVGLLLVIVSVLAFLSSPPG